MANAGAQRKNERLSRWRAVLIQLPYTARSGTARANASAIEPRRAAHANRALNNLDSERRDQQPGMQRILRESPRPADTLRADPGERAIKKDEIAQQAERISEEAFAIAPEPIFFRPGFRASRCVPSIAVRCPESSGSAGGWRMRAVRGKNSRVATMPPPVVVMLGVSGTNICLQPSL